MPMVSQLPNRIPASRSFPDAFPLHALANPAFSPLTIELLPSIYVTSGTIRIPELNPTARANFIRRRVTIPRSEAQVETTNRATIRYTRVIHSLILCHCIPTMLQTLVSRLAGKVPLVDFRFRRLSDGMRRPVSAGCVTLPMIDALVAQGKGDRL